MAFNPGSFRLREYEAMQENARSGASTNVPSYTQQTGRDLPTNVGTPFGQATSTPTATPTQVKQYNTDLSKAVSDTNNALKDANKFIADAQKLLNSKNTSTAKKQELIAGIESAKAQIDLINTVIKPSLNELSKSNNPLATYSGENIDAINQALINAGGGGPGGTPITELLGYGTDEYYTSTGSTGVSNTNKKYINGKLVSEEEWVSYINGGGTTTPKTSTSNLPISDKEMAERRDAFALVESTMRGYGFNETELKEILDYIKTGLLNPRMGANQLVLDLRQLSAYKSRFAGNETRRKAGLNALSEAEYLAQEKDYSETLRRFGQQRLANRAQFATLIGNDISNTELSTRVNTAVNRLVNANPIVKAQLKSFYPTINDSDIVAYFLSPTEALPELEAKVTTAEIGATAAQYGLEADLARATELQKYGVDLARARTGYENIAQVLPRTEMLSDIYKQTGIDYTQATAEAEEFKGLASARRARNQLAQLEAAAFSGSSGLGRTSLTRNIGGAI